MEIAQACNRSRYRSMISPKRALRYTRGRGSERDDRKKEKESEREPERKRSVASPRVEEEADARGVSFGRRGGSIEGRRLKNSERH
ncbi:hypothetical protein ALC53_13045 [Atta colombica]|uniref:Uncharacterized protein n=1 Tax=Atta colombica TaxID=520822 RepID=A0A195AWQ3_9HYME|nr:hypothetical protein ALC53_13045 [Atta colombica]